MGKSQDLYVQAKEIIPGGTQLPPEEVVLAEKLINLHPWAEMARFTRSGGEAMMVAVRIARTVTGKDIVLFSDYGSTGYYK